MNFSTLKTAATGLATNIQQKAKEAAHEAGHFAQQARDAATGTISDRVDDDDSLPELRTHVLLDKHLRRLYKHAEEYRRAFAALADASKLIADDFADALDSYPDLKMVADRYCAQTHATLTDHIHLLSGMLNEKLFKPLHRELEGRKDIAKALADRRKVRADYHAFRRKQLILQQSDPANFQVYSKKLDDAHSTFERHSQIVANDLAAVAQERDTALREAFMAFTLTQSDFHRSMHVTVCADVDVSSFVASPLLIASWRSVEQLLARGKASLQPTDRSLNRLETSPSAGSTTAVTSSNTQPPLQTLPANIGGECVQLSVGGLSTSGSRVDHQQQQQLPYEHRRPVVSRAKTAPLSSSAHFTGDLLSGCSTPSDARAISAKKASEGSGGFDEGGLSCEGIDLLSGEVIGLSVAGSRSSSKLDLMDDGMNSTGSCLDDIFQLGAAQPLMPSASDAPSVVKTQYVPSVDTKKNFDMISEFGRGESVHDSVSTPDISGLGDDAMSRLGVEFGVNDGCRLVLNSEPVGVSDRAFYAQRREQLKQAAIEAKVEHLRVLKEAEEVNRDRERELEKSVNARVQAWQKEKKNLRALLASLHEIAPPCAWKAHSLAELLDPAAVKRAYRKALLAVHPDKQEAGDVEKKVLAQHIFDALREAWCLFERSG